MPATREHPMSARGSLNTMIRVHVGRGAQKKQPYRLYKAVLVAQSKFFSAALASGMREAQTRIVRFPEGDPEAFDIFACWCLTGTLRLSIDDVSGETCKEVASHDKEKGESIKSPVRIPRTAALAANTVRTPCRHLTTSQLIRAYCFGDMLIALPFKSAVINELIGRCEMHARLPSCADVRYVYENTHETSILRDLLVDQVAWSSGDAHFKGTVSQWPSEFVESVMEAVMSRRGTGVGNIEDAPWYDDVCEAYHEHDRDDEDGLPCRWTTSFHDWAEVRLGLGG